MVLQILIGAKTASAKPSWHQNGSAQTSVSHHYQVPPWYITNDSLHKDICIPTLQNLGKITYKKSHKTYSTHSNPFIKQLSSKKIPGNSPRRLKRNCCRDLAVNELCPDYISLKKLKYPGKESLDSEILYNNIFVRTPTLLARFCRTKGHHGESDSSVNLVVHIFPPWSWSSCILPRQLCRAEFTHFFFGYSSKPVACVVAAVGATPFFARVYMLGFLLSGDTESRVLGSSFNQTGPNYHTSEDCQVGSTIDPLPEPVSIILIDFSRLLQTDYAKAENTISFGVASR
ncbi:disrupted in renal carcinoma protein 2-like [Aphis craccivora]|uniref:Disrupted in renal carcinoma protein 2-like n=1 Tax=Aphis craccivora TaxID=307492 RepID=A0A6G0ZQ62_APHCR|nr:disrupted in renal carcinoma protein 2-like [Aphis craccivora]